MSQHSDTSANNANNPQPHELLWVELGERRYPIWIGLDVRARAAEQMNRDGHPAAHCAVVIDSNVARRYDGATGSNGNGERLPDGNNNNGGSRKSGSEATACGHAHAHGITGGNVLNVAIEGESAKSMRTLGAIYDRLAEQKIGRDGALVAIGGGVTGDLAGFAAASYLRGIDFYQIPTTLLAMVDSSVGGKTGINITAGKNLVGSFWQPKAVFISTSYLETLPQREFAAGMAEVIKYGMLYDAALFAELEQHVEAGHCRLAWNHPALPKIIRRCCEIKAAIVGEDERETKKDGGRALLNLGHTFAHAIENAAGYGTYLHGEAVGIGLVMAARLSEELTRRNHSGYRFTAADTARVRALVAACQLPTALNQPLGGAAATAGSSGAAVSQKPATSGACGSNTMSAGEAPAPVVIPPALPLRQLQEAMGRDKKVLGGKIRFVAMEAIGKAVTTNGVDAALIDELWREFGAAD